MTEDRDKMQHDLVRAFGVPFAVVGLKHDDVLEFVRDRIAEDEQTANAAAADQQTPTWVYVDGENVTPHPSTGNSYVACGPWESSLGPVGEHIAQHDPARALAAAAAHRVIVDQHTPETVDEGWNLTVTYCRTCRYDSGLDRDVFPCRTLRALASTWSGHLDFDPEWAP